MEVILREDVEKVRRARRGGESSRRLRPQFSAAEKARRPGHRIQSRRLSSRNGKAYLRREAKAQAEAQDLAKMMSNVVLTFRQHVSARTINCSVR